MAPAVVVDLELVPVPAPLDGVAPHATDSVLEARTLLAPDMVPAAALETALASLSTPQLLATLLAHEARHPMGR